MIYDLRMTNYAISASVGPSALNYPQGANPIAESNKTHSWEKATGFGRPNLDPNQKL